jgi:hypothetical protein
LVLLGTTGILLAITACGGAIGLCVKLDYVFSPDIVQVFYRVVALGIATSY